MTKTVSKLSEEGKVAVRNVRRDAIKQVRPACLIDRLLPHMKRPYAFEGPHWTALALFG